ncbi:MAG: exo-alpha-sialidase [Acidobacteria bacterium]|nr:exo-alpha-sialidase [Acidobacteriota bacterium]
MGRQSAMFAFLIILLLAGCSGNRLRTSSGGKAARPVPGGPEEPVRYIGGEEVLPYHDGGLRPAVGVKNFQVFRANRAHPEMADQFGWTYNHAPMLAYWNGRFYLEYLSSPVHENHPPMRALLTTSADGETWDMPTVVFPPMTLPDGRATLVHQRMGFHVAADGRLLVLAYYGLPPHPNDGTGVGRVVREIGRDGNLGPIHFIRYSSHNGFGETNTPFPFHTASPDPGFRKACEDLLANKLVTMQWWEEDRSTDGFYYPMGQVLKALSFFHRRDGTVVGLWKDSWTAISRDEGSTWSSPVQAETLVMASAKVWGQKTKDGRFALVYNPRKDNRHRWPLAIVTSDDGILFDNMLAVCGEVPPRRYNGLDKAFGPQYVRGIVEGNGIPPGDVMWVAYSMNKDDIWVSRIPLPVRGHVTQPVRDDFNTGTTADLAWNLYCPRWAPVRLVDFPSASNRSLELSDREPHDYAKAVRVFPEAKALTARFKILARQRDTGRLEIDLDDRYGWRSPLRLRLDEQGRILALDGNQNEPAVLGKYEPGRWYALEVKADLDVGRFDVTLDGKTVLEKAELLDPVESFERICFRTGPYRIEPLLRDPKSPGADVPHADDPVPQAVFHIDDLEVGVIRPAGTGSLGPNKE